ncbi:T9SS type B sorting domain-containing protein [Flavobacterium lindanitolerans]|uniref:Gliding motility-associated-like protein n=1 Tax=Flavobacterium lindanitolerans TaxID=428988 RepID=A0A497V1V1_9FLAO|nr:T9SS type B sorting domain-containing protein [Flavobacterium lindanitolerans]MBC8645218.1 T9SS type B sorting domain-containing protein [Flavobacterium lindanitolerans]PKW29801.1 gliding motility-associated-like protein [Flavobacterium lindanitolerans]RLJ34698.1 gliding motility-associated-like protein [Flavobacterium lindanitolerans]
MIKKILSFIILSIIIQTESLGQDFQWVRQIKGIVSDYNDFAIGLAVDSNENSYLIGDTESPLFDMDPTIDGVEIIDNSHVQNFQGTYLIKVDSDGNYIWGMTFGNYRRSDHAYDIKIGKDGNIYALLSIHEYNSSTNVIDSFIKIVKISPDGNIISTKSIPQVYGNNRTDILYTRSFDLDDQNNIFLCGFFIGNFIIDNNPSLSLNSNGNGIGNYILKINNDGSFAWVKQFNSSDNSYNKLIVRPDGNINYLQNNFSDYTLYNIDNSTNSIIWQKNFINQAQKDFHVSNNGITLLGRKHDFQAVVDVDPSSGVVSISGNNRFIIFLNLDGTFLDVKQFQVPVGGDISFTALTTDDLGNFFIGGTFNATVDFDPSSNINNLTPSNYGDIFYLKLDSNRNFDNVIKFGQELPLQSSYNICLGYQIKQIKVINNNNYLFGEFSGVCDFDPSPTTFTSLKSFNSITYNLDGFLQKLGPCTTSSPPLGDNNQTFCSSRNPTIANLTPNSSSIKWYDSPTSGNLLNPTTALINAQTYYASKQTGTCPESSPRLPVTVNISQSPVAPIAANQVFCESERATISSLIALGQDIRWYSSLTDVHSLPTTTILQNNTNYYASQTTGGCESNRTLINVTINSVSSPVLSSPQTFCQQQNATLNDIIINGSNIQWYDSQIGGNLLASNLLLIDGTTYYASQTINSCESSRIPITISIQNTAIPTGDSTQTFCSTDSPTLTNIAINGSNIIWYDSSGTALPSTEILVNGEIYYASQTINNCESINRLPVTVLLTNTLNANDYSASICDNLNDGLEIINLADYNTNLISNTSIYTFNYYRSLLGATNEISSELINSSTSYNLTGDLSEIYVRLTSTGGCHQVVKLSINLLKSPILTIPDTVALCEGRIITVNAGTGFDSYLWSTGSNSESIIISQAGIYSVTVTKRHGNIICSSTKNFTVILSNAATISTIDIQDWTDTENTIVINTNGLGDYEFSIDGINYQASNVFSRLASGVYMVYVRDKNRCGIVKDDVALLMYPRFFTPNNDGYNDNWSINFSSFEPGLKVDIFDRYGKFLKTLNHMDSWDGKYNGQELPSTDYWFVASRKNGKKHKGHFSLKR